MVKILLSDYEVSGTSVGTILSLGSKYTINTPRALARNKHGIHHLLEKALALLYFAHNLIEQALQILRLKKQNKTKRG